MPWLSIESGAVVDERRLKSVLDKFKPAQFDLIHVLANRFSNEPQIAVGLELLVMEISGQKPTDLGLEHPDTITS